MRWLADENIEASIVAALLVAGEDVTTVVSLARSTSDERVVALALTTERLVLTRDTDFGDLVVRHRLPVSGVVLLRLRRLPYPEQSAILLDAIRRHGERLYGSFTVIQRHRIRIRPLRETNGQP